MHKVAGGVSGNKGRKIKTEKLKIKIEDQARAR
jgi:hypothetical protein